MILVRTIRNWLCFLSLVGALALATRTDGISVSRYSYGAIAYSPATGKIGLAYNLRSRKSAEKAALDDCAADDARVVCWINRGFCALALGDDKTCWGIGYDYGDRASSQKAMETALADCQKRTRGAHVVVAMSSDGQYFWKPGGAVIETPELRRDADGTVTVPGLGGMTFAPNGDILGADGKKLYDGKTKTWTPESGIKGDRAGSPSPSPSATAEPKRATPAPAAIEFNPEPQAVFTPRPKPTPRK